MSQFERWVGDEDLLSNEMMEDIQAYLVSVGHIHELTPPTSSGVGSEAGGLKGVPASGFKLGVK